MPWKSKQMTAKRVTRHYQSDVFRLLFHGVTPSFRIEELGCHWTENNANDYCRKSFAKVPILLDLD
jgi:hypothetical protein